MSNVNLNLNAERVFGRFMPTVYIKRVYVEHNDTAEHPAAQENVKVRANLDISFTKPDNFSRSYIEGDERTTREFMQNVLHQLVLHVWLSPFAKLNKELENSSLNLQDLFIQFRDIMEISQENFTANHPLWNVVKEEAASMLADGERPFGYGPEIDAESLIAELNAVVDEDAIMKIFFSAGFADLLVFTLRQKLIEGDDETFTSILGSIDQPGSIIAYLFFGSDGPEGPWVTPNSVDFDHLKSLFMALASASGDMSEEEYAEMLSPPEDSDLIAAAAVLPSDDTPGQTDSFLYQYIGEVVDRHQQNASQFRQHHKFRLTDLIEEGNPTGSSLIFRKAYDADNEEIITISNIEVAFAYQAEQYDPNDDLYSDYIQEIIKSLESIFIGATVCVTDVDELEMAENTPREFFNHLFGNISYEHVLSYNAVPNPYIETYVFSKSKHPYDGIPIQGLNGRYYADEPQSKEKIVDRYTKLINKHKAEAPNDPQLEINLSNLTTVLSKYKQSSNLVKYIKRFQRIFTDKSPTKPSGQFYTEFVKTMTDINRKVMKQEEVEKRIVIAGTCVDIRPPRHIGNEYYLPRPNLNADNTEIYSTDPETCYQSSPWIPQSWSKVYRELQYLHHEDKYARSELEEYRNEVIRQTVAEYADTPGVTEEMILYAVEQKVLEESGEAYDSTGGVLDMIVKNHGYFFFDWEKALYTQSAIAQIVDLPKFCVFFGIPIPYDSFMVEGVVLLREELDLTFDPMEEPGIDSSDGPSGPVPLKYVTMHSKFNLNKQIPELFTTHHTVSDQDFKYGIPVYAGSYPDSSIPPRYSCVKYVYFDTTATEATRNVTLMGNSLHRMGPDNGYVQNVSPAGSNAALSSLIGIGNRWQDYAFQRSEKSYRILAFEFEDYMDDDVAVLNSPPMGFTSEQAEEHFGSDGADSRRHRYIQANLNPFEEPSSHYKIRIDVRDTTLDMFILLKDKFITPLVRAWEEYYEYAEELCSYNAAEESFNKFFIDAMVEKYAAVPTGYDKMIDDVMISDEATTWESFGSAFADFPFNFTEFAKSFPPWVSAAFLTAIIKEVFFNVTPRADLYKVRSKLVGAMAEFDPEAAPPDPAVVNFVQEMYSISPQKGNIDSLRAFNEKLQPLMDIFDLNDPRMRDKLGELYGRSLDEGMSGEALSTELKGRPRSLAFHSSMPINTPIAMKNEEKFYLGSSFNEQSEISVGEIPAFITEHISTTLVTMEPPYGARMYALMLSGPAFRTAHNYLVANGAAFSNSDYIIQFMKYLPDYENWQQRWVGDGATPTPPGLDPADFGDPAGPSNDLRFRVVLPETINNQRILDHDPNTRAYWEVIEVNAPGQPGYPRPKRVKFHWWTENPGGGDFSIESVTAGAYTY